MIPLQVFLATSDLPQPADPNATQALNVLQTKLVSAPLGNVPIHAHKPIAEKMPNVRCKTTLHCAGAFPTTSEIHSIDATFADPSLLKGNKIRVPRILEVKMQTARR